jgi:hypothetical protein
MAVGESRADATIAPLDEADHPTQVPGPKQETAVRQDVERLAAAVREIAVVVTGFKRASFLRRELAALCDLQRQLASRGV